MNFGPISNFWVLSSSDAQSVRSEKKEFCVAAGDTEYVSIRIKWQKLSVGRLKS